MRNEELLESKGVYRSICRLLGRSTSVRIAVAYLTEDGYSVISDDIERFLRRDKNNKLDFVVGMSNYCITEPAALDSLVRLRKLLPKQVRVRYYYNEGFHPKMFIFEHDDDISLMVGSSNLTWQGINHNVEANLAITRPKNSHLVSAAQTYFDKLMVHAAENIEQASMFYKKIYKRFAAKKGDSSWSRGTGGRFRTNLPPQYFESNKIIEESESKCKLIWKISPGIRGREWSQWLKSDGTGRIAIGWDDKDEIGRLSDYRSQEDLQRHIDLNRKRWGGTWVEKGERGGTKDPSWYVAQQLWRFYRGTKKESVVIAYSNRTFFAMGVVAGKYQYSEEPHYYGHRKSVKWLAVPNQRVLDKALKKALWLRPTIFPIDSPMIIRKAFDLVLNR